VLPPEGSVSRGCFCPHLPGRETRLLWFDLPDLGSRLRQGRAVVLCKRDADHRHLTVQASASVLPANAAVTPPGRCYQNVTNELFAVLTLKTTVAASA